MLKEQARNSANRCGPAGRTKPVGGKADQPGVSPPDHMKEVIPMQTQSSHSVPQRSTNDVAAAMQAEADRLAGMAIANAAMAAGFSKTAAVDAAQAVVYGSNRNFGGSIASGIRLLPDDLRSGQPQAMYCIIGPAEAVRIMGGNDANRKLRNSRVEQYADDIAAGRFTLSNDAISFYVTGQLAVGQHRCEGVLRSGMPIVALVQLGLPIAAAVNLDRPAARMGEDNLRISAALRGLKVDITRTDVAIGRAFVGHARGHMPMAVLEGLIKRYGEALRFARVHGPSARYVCNAHVLAGVAAAYLAGVDAETLTRFCKVLDSGISVASEEAIIIRVRNKLMALGGATSTLDEARRTVMKGIALFAAGENPSRLVVPDYDIYPMGTIEGETA